MPVRTPVARLVADVDYRCNRDRSLLGIKFIRVDPREPAVADPENVSVIQSVALRGAFYKKVCYSDDEFFGAIRDKFASVYYDFKNQLVCLLFNTCCDLYIDTIDPEIIKD